MSLPIEFQNDQFNITETPTGLTIAIGRDLTGFPEVQESIRQLMMVALKFMLTEDLERERRQDAEDRESDIREAVRQDMEQRKVVEQEVDDLNEDDRAIDDREDEAPDMPGEEPAGSAVDEREQE